MHSGSTSFVMEIGGIKRGIQRRLIKTMLIIGIFPLVAGLYVTYLDVTKSLRDSIGKDFQAEALETAYKVDMIINKEVVDVQRFAISPYIGEAIRDRHRHKAELTNYLKEFKDYTEKEIYNVMIVDSRGDYIAGITETWESNYRNENWFNFAYNSGKGRVYVGDVRLDERNGRYLMNIAVPVMDHSAVIGVVAIKYTVDSLLETINNVRIGQSGHANLVDSAGTIIMCPIFPLRSHHINFELIYNITSRNRPGWIVTEDDAHGGQGSTVGFAPVEATSHPERGWFDNNRWYVFIRQNPDEMYAPIYALLIRISVFGAVLIVFLALTGVYAARKIVMPINELYKGVELFAQGRLDHRMNIRTHDEIEKLADEFNNMAEELNKTYSALEERKRELEISEGRYKDLVENSPEMIHSVNPDGYMINVNKTELETLGYTIEEMQNKRLEDIAPPEFKNIVVNHRHRTIKEGKSRVETQFITKDQRKIDVEIFATALYHPTTGRFVKTRAFVRDITDRKAIERHLKEYHELLEQKVSDRTRELQETKDYLENLLETANDVIYTLNPDGAITYVNKKIEEWGYRKEELIGRSFLTILSRRHRGERFRKTVTDGIKQTYEVEVTDKAGGKKYAVLSISPLKNNEGKIIGVLGIVNDITERKSLEQQIAQAEKMSAIGQLAAGIAHEINNPIGGILNCLYNLRKKRLSPEREDEYLKSMEDGIQRVQRTIDQLLDFSQQHETAPTDVDINRLVGDVLSFMDYAIAKNGIRLTKEFDPHLPKLMLDHHKMGQVVMNTLLNAIQAMKEEGEIKIRTYQEEGWCCIDITDNGIGIPSQILPRIFDPFFTTKDVGKGTGLGLAVSLGIVEKHLGKIDVRSEEGKGATFTIKLPLKALTIPLIHPSLQKEEA